MISAYENKILAEYNPDNAYYYQVRQDIEAKYGGLDFSIFIRHALENIADAGRRRKKCDPHWRPYYSKYTFCKINIKYKKYIFNNYIFSPVI